MELWFINAACHLPENDMTITNLLTLVDAAYILKMETQFRGLSRVLVKGWSKDDVEVLLDETFIYRAALGRLVISLTRFHETLT